MSTPAIPFAGMKKQLSEQEEQIKALQSSMAEINKDFIELTEQANRAISKNNEDVNQAIEAQASIVAAVITVLEKSVPNFQQLVREEIVAAHKSKRDAETEKAKSNLNEWKTKGFIKPATVVGKNSIVVLQDMDAKKDPPEVVSPFTVAQFSLLTEERKDLFLNKSVGDSLNIVEGLRSDILEIWDIDQEAVKASKAEQTKEG